MSSEMISPFRLLWQYNYPFAYWYNRLEKINPYNKHDKLEALYCLVQLTDIYSHVFAANVRNPELPWFFLKEKTYRGDIDAVLDDLRVEGYPTVGTISENPDGLMTIEANEEYDLDEMDAIAGALLGCPFRVDEETKTVEFEEPAELHRGACNAILDYAEKQTALLNDFKHGFRVVPLTPNDLETLTESIIAFSEEDRKQFDAIIEALKEALAEDEWGFCFARMYTEKADYGYDCQLDVYHVDAWSCYKFAELTLDALYNLVTPGQGRLLEETWKEFPGPVLDGEESIMDHIFGFSTPLRDNPDTVISEEDLRSE